IHPKSVQTTDLPKPSPTPVLESNEYAKAPTPPPKSKQKVEQVTAPAEFNEKDSQIPLDVPPDVPRNTTPVPGGAT
ncbi:MAG: hypothetical protein F6J94_31585, partial [Moorea sp. SIO1F2]|uniref:hypothetical protein n=1 Tax=Moorena sp. SIO1F2 TaxID=2607819 RepID=UPI0013BCCAB1